MKTERVVAYSFALAALAASFFVYMEYVYMLGFPDGYISDSGRAERSVAYVFVGVSVALSLYSAYLGAAASRNRIGKQLSAVIILYFVMIILMLAVDHYLSLRLDDGRGG